MEKKLYRKEYDKMFGGVCSGLADYLSIDVSLVRLVFILMAIFGLSGVLVYIILWIVLPVKNMPDMPIYKEKDPERMQPYTNKSKSNARLIVGLILIGLGFYFFLHEFHFIPHWFNLGRLWPLVFIIPGILILSNATKKKTFEYENKEKTAEPDTTKAADTNSDEPVI